MSYSDSESDNEYEMCCGSGGQCSRNGPSARNVVPFGLNFDPAAIENVILTISDKFDFRVIMSDSRTKGAVLVTTGLTLAGGLFGRHYGGKIGAVVGGAIGGACGLGLVAISMREIWNEIRSKLSELIDIVYDYLAGLGLDDYRKAAEFIINNQSGSMQLAMVVLETTGNILGKKIVSSLTAA